MPPELTPNTPPDTASQKILAIDLGKLNSVACEYEAASGNHSFTTIPTTPQTLHDLLAERQPRRVVIDVGSAAGWAKHRCEAIQVVNPNPTSRSPLPPGR